MNSAAAMAMPTPETDLHRPSGGRLVSTDGVELPLTQVSLSVEAEGGIARTRLTQRFANHHDQPLEVEYQLPLPADGAVSGFSFLLGDQRSVGEVDRRARARQRFEEAILSGRTAALVEQERSSLFTQLVGNIPPGTEVVAEITVDQRLRWLDEGAWEWRFPTVVGPRYLPESGSRRRGPSSTSTRSSTSAVSGRRSSGGRGWPRRRPSAGPRRA